MVETDGSMDFPQRRKTSHAIQLRLAMEQAVESPPGGAGELPGIRPAKKGVSPLENRGIALPAGRALRCFVHPEGAARPGRSGHLRQRTGPAANVRGSAVLPIGCSRNSGIPTE